MYIATWFISAVIKLWGKDSICCVCGVFHSCWLTRAWYIYLFRLLPVINRCWYIIIIAIGEIFEGQKFCKFCY